MNNIENLKSKASEFSTSKAYGLETFLVSDKSPLPNDEDILQSIENSMEEECGHDMVVTISNADNEVYRVVTCKGPHPYFALIKSLTKLGMKDLYQDEIFCIDGVDSAFVLQ